MSGIHDLGGKPGYGAVDVTGDEELAFYAHWEERVWGIALSYTRPADFNLPKFRVTRELEQPQAYLERPYFDQWYKAHACMLLGWGLVTIEELTTGVADDDAPFCEQAPMSASDVDAVKQRIDHSARVDEGNPRFAVGDRVIALKHVASLHTRLPDYVRGHPGIVTAYHGRQALDDAAAQGRTVLEPLYTVRFDLRDLFPERRDSANRVHLELWENYLCAAEAGAGIGA